MLATAAVSLLLWSTNQATRHGRPGLHPCNSGTPLIAITQRDPSAGHPPVIPLPAASGSSLSVKLRLYYRAAVCRRQRGRSDRRTRAWSEFRGDRVVWGWWVRVCLPRMCPDVDTRECPVSAPVSFARLGVQQVVFISTGDAGRVSVISGCTGNGAAGVVGHPDFSTPSRAGVACTNQDGACLGGCLRTFILQHGERARGISPDGRPCPPVGPVLPVGSIAAEARPRGQPAYPHRHSCQPAQNRAGRDDRA